MIKTHSKQGIEENFLSKLLGNCQEVILAISTSFGVSYTDFSLILILTPTIN